MTHWWEWIGWVVGVVGGVYGSARAWLTARNLSITADRWTIVTNDGVNFILTNRTPYATSRVRVELPHGMFLAPGVTRQELAQEVLQPGQSVTFNAAPAQVAPGAQVKIQWRYGLRFRDHTAYVALPRFDFSRPRA